MILDSSLSPAQRVTLSNTICAALESARDLERMGLLRIRRIQKREAKVLAFFDLTPAGESFVNQHYVVPEAPSQRTISPWLRASMCRGACSHRRSAF